MTKFREHAKEYLDAESMADDYLYEILFKIILQVHADIHSEG